ncbi:SAM-dependent methyltransferase [Paenibacillus borealis]|uniref:SAM-dependent methyltransferase n=1 Tax=Paenibacillus borealis TaxID=160799 RepID=UPI000B098A59|nr:cyclopropane-fatty-acyl-phospholipid synthase family protein [Paenibacillus borealis]
MNIPLEKSIYKKILKNISSDPFTVTFWDGTTEQFNEGTAPTAPLFRLTFHKPLNKSEVLSSAMNAFAEAYMDGTLIIEGNLEKIIESAFNNKESFLNRSKLLTNLSKLKGNSAKKSKADISYHYDLGNEFYRLWLDETMSYSCAYFKTPGDTLYEAQLNKIHHTLKKLSLQPGQKLLDIGCGWGYLIIEAAKLYQVQALGITLSEEQYKKAKQRIEEEGLTGQVDVQLVDYRELSKKELSFDRVVSVGMLEHVGRVNIPVFMDEVDKLLTEGGAALLHCITGLVETEGNDFLMKYIFPGGYIPSIRELVDHMSRHNFRINDLENLRLHYHRTLQLWVHNFEANLESVREQFDERFIRMWRLYLNACAANFTAGITNLHQFVITKGVNNTLPLTRDYLYK